MKKLKQETTSCNVGDIFSILLGKDIYGFAIIVNIKDGWDLAQLFAYISNIPKFTTDITDSKLLQPPFSFNLKDIEVGKLPIIKSDSQFAPQDLDSVTFYMGEKGNFRLIKINEYRPGINISDEEAKSFSRMEFYAIEGMIQRVKNILSENGMKLTHKIIKKNN